MLSRIIRRLRRLLWEEESGATATEYAVMIALIVLVCIGAVSALGTKVSTIFVTAEQGW